MKKLISQKALVEWGVKNKEPRREGWTELSVRRRGLSQVGLGWRQVKLGGGVTGSRSPHIKMEIEEGGQEGGRGSRLKEVGGPRRKNKTVTETARVLYPLRGERQGNELVKGGVSG